MWQQYFRPCAVIHRTLIDRMRTFVHTLVMPNRTYNDHLKNAELLFLEEVGKIVRVQKRRVSAKVIKGHQMSFLDLEGEDRSDHSVTAALSMSLAVTAAGTCMVKATVQGTNVYSGVFTVEKSLNASEASAEAVAQVCLSAILGDRT